jgi:hypothetical protein
MKIKPLQALFERNAFRPGVNTKTRLESKLEGNKSYIFLSTEKKKTYL